MATPQTVNIKVTLSNQTDRDKVVRYMQCDSAWSALYAIREYFHDQYSGRATKSSRDHYERILEILANHRLDLDFNWEPKELPKL